jgi:hypothetical protein
MARRALGKIIWSAVQQWVFDQCSTCQSTATSFAAQIRLEVQV